MYWLKIRVDDGTERGVSYSGASQDSPESISEKAVRGEFIRLDDLFYYDRGDIKDWGQWEPRDEPSVLINSKRIVSIQAFKGDPRLLPKQGG